MVEKNSGTRGNSGTPLGVVEKIVAHAPLFPKIRYFGLAEFLDGILESCPSLGDARDVSERVHGLHDISTCVKGVEMELCSLNSAKLHQGNSETNSV